MSAIPAWLAATAGHGTLAGQVNQLFGGHTSAWLYAGGTQRAAQATGAATYQSTQSQWLAQEFTTAAGQTQIGMVWLQISTVGGSPTTATIPPLTIGLYASSGDTPTGTALASTTVTEQQVYGSGFWLQVPLAAAVTPSTVYQLVVSPAGTAGHYYVWQQSIQSPGASMSLDGSTWTSQSYGLTFQIFDQGTSGQVQFLYDDGGSRVTQLSYTQGQLSSVTESVLAQDGTMATFTRSLTYSGGFLVGVS